VGAISEAMISQAASASEAMINQAASAAFPEGQIGQRF